MVERICTILVINLMMFYKTLRYKFVSDDIPGRDNAKKANNAFQRILNQLIGNGNYGEEEGHLITIILHSLVCIFIYLGLGRNDVSFMASLLFCVNPRNNQGSVWLAARYSYVIPTLLFLISMTFPYIAPLAIWYATKSATSFITPIGFLGSQNWWFVLIMPVVWCMHFKVFRSQVKTKMQIESVNADKAFSPKKFIIAIKTYGFYFFMALIPHKITFYHSFMQSAAGSGNDFMNKRAFALDKVFWFGVLVLTFFPLYWIFHGWDAICWGILWFSVSIAPFLNIIRVQQEISERYVYCANVGLMFALANILSPPLFMFFFAMYAARLWWGMDMYKDEYWIREYCVKEDTESWFVWHMRALHRWDVQSYHEAFAMWVMCRMISPKEFKVLINLAIVLKILQKYQDYKFTLLEAESNIVPGQEVTARKIIHDVRTISDINELRRMIFRMEYGNSFDKKGDRAKTTKG